MNIRYSPEKDCNIKTDKVCPHGSDCRWLVGTPTWFSGHSYDEITKTGQILPFYFKADVFRNSISNTLNNSQAHQISYSQPQIGCYEVNSVSEHDYGSPKPRESFEQQEEEKSERCPKVPLESVKKRLFVNSKKIKKLTKKPWMWKTPQSSKNFCSKCCQKISKPPHSSRLNSKQKNLIVSIREQRKAMIKEQKMMKRLKFALYKENRTAKN